MVRILITGGAGTIGSALAEKLIASGVETSILDIERFDEAWKLKPIRKKLQYIWKSQYDITKDDIDGYDVIIDCATGFPERAFGISSPTHALFGNLLPQLNLLEAVRGAKKRPIIIYPSSFSVMYGHASGTVIMENLSPAPSSLYGWTKSAAEQLYLTYYKAYDIPVVITRVSAGYGLQMRSDELVAKLIMHCLNEKPFHQHSPRAKRLWTYLEDVVLFYAKLLEKPEAYLGSILHCAGNRGDKIVTNIELAQLVQQLTGKKIPIVEGDYEPGENVFGNPVDINFDSSKTRSLLGWAPQFTLEEGLLRTIEWFKRNEYKFIDS